MSQSLLNTWRFALIVAGFWVVGFGPTGSRAAGPEGFEVLATDYEHQALPLLRTFCLKCHSTEEAQGDLDLERFAGLTEIRSSTRTWRKVAEMLDNGEMPPKKAPKPTTVERAALRGWVGRYLDAEAHDHAGDPGPVVLRRLNNAQYSYTLRDLTGVDLHPAREFPAEGAAGEGFTNAGNALAMSPALMGKYFDAGKAVASHAVLLPDGLRFSAGLTRRDWTDELLGQIRALYRSHADEAGAIPLTRYFAAALTDRAALASGTESVETVAARNGLNPRYLGLLWKTLNGDQSTPLLDGLRARWRAARGPGDAETLRDEVGRWQKALTRFQPVGHMKPWIVPMNPVTGRQDLRYRFPDKADGGDLSVFLVVEGDGPEQEVTWESPRLVKPGQAEYRLRDLRAFTAAMAARRPRVIASVSACLEAAAEVAEGIDSASLAAKYQVEPETLRAWLAYLGLDGDQNLRVELLTEQTQGAGGQSAVKGWGSPETPNVVANSSGVDLPIPGHLKAHGFAVHPGPDSLVAVGWSSPSTMTVKLTGAVEHVHPECGNGVTWVLEARSGSSRRRLASGEMAGGPPRPLGPVEGLAVKPGELISVLIGPRDNHACDLTAVDLRIEEVGGEGRVWDLAREVAPDILAGNPHADASGRPGVWRFYREAIQGTDRTRMVPSGSVLERWLATQDRDARRTLAAEVQRKLEAGSAAAGDGPDGAMVRQLTAIGGPLLADRAAIGEDGSAWGLDPSTFGKGLKCQPLPPETLSLRTPTVVEIRLPADLAAGGELVGSLVLRPRDGSQGWTQARLLGERPTTGEGLRADTLVLVVEGEELGRFVRAFDDFRERFPAALCYEKIVPVDEAVTLTLFHRDDEPLRRLMLDEAESARLDRLWDELHFVSQDALTQVEAFDHLMEYATQDGDPRMFEPYRKPIRDHAEAFRGTLVAAEPRQLDAAISWANLAYRRPLIASEEKGLRDLYARLRREELPHDEAIRLTLARILVAPPFLYRIEKAPAGPAAGPVSDWEMATRLAYFLRSSAPDSALREAAAAGQLRDPEVLVSQTRRLLRSAENRRLAEEFACQWLHVYGFADLNEKSERHFPTFPGLRGAMAEEAIRFFADLFATDASVLSILDADHAFLNGPLAEHYGIPDVAGPEWRRVDGVRAYHRGGVLGLSATLAKEAGASRTSPILRGNWVTETLLGEKLPKPPKDVPLLPEDEGAGGGKSVRELVMAHTADERCSGCHARMDPYGFALEGYDAIGRWRDRDVANHPIDDHARLLDGNEFDGVEGLRRYLLGERREAVVGQFCRKLLGYALGRGVQLSDEPLLDEIQSRLKAENYRVGAAVESIVLSRQFREIRGADAPDTDNP